MTDEELRAILTAELVGRVEDEDALIEMAKLLTRSLAALTVAHCAGDLECIASNSETLAEIVKLECATAGESFRAYMQQTEQ